MFLDRFEKLKKAIYSCSYTVQNQEITEEEALDNFHSLIQKTSSDRGVVYFIGNGGSAAIASHFANDFLKALKIAALTLNDSSLLTCFSNDYGYEHVFSKSLATLINPSDLLIAISSSGNSANILNAVKVAQGKGCNIITLSGFRADNLLQQEGNLNFWIESEDYGIVETSHFFILHTIVDLWKHSTYVYAREDQIPARN